MWLNAITKDYFVGGLGPLIWKFGGGGGSMLLLLPVYRSKKGSKGGLTVIDIYHYHSNHDCMFYSYTHVENMYTHGEHTYTHGEHTHTWEHTYKHGEHTYKHGEHTYKHGEHKVHTWGIHVHTNRILWSFILCMRTSINNARQTLILKAFPYKCWLYIYVVYPFGTLGIILYSCRLLIYIERRTCWLFLRRWEEVSSKVTALLNIHLTN